MVGVFLALAFAVAGPPRAYFDTGSARLPLSVVSWCWDHHCAAPFTASAKTAVIRRNSTARIDLAFAPKTVHVTVGGRDTTVTKSGDEISWPATGAGGVSIRVTGAGGWVNYVARIRFR
ncbi:MAG TPA: hypothetical protein VFB25_06295 [Gaiellaceae bacterium]|nr:hypothetical protein [Gaiellaceae bacterium]